jgi:hypothetical protein
MLPRHATPARRWLASGAVLRPVRVAGPGGAPHTAGGGGCELWRLASGGGWGEAPGTAGLDVPWPPHYEAVVQDRLAGATDEGLCAGSSACLGCER